MELYRMHRSAIAYAVKHRLPLGRMSNGHYYLCYGDKVTAISMFPTAKSAINMMRKAMR